MNTTFTPNALSFASLTFCALTSACATPNAFESIQFVGPTATAATATPTSTTIAAPQDIPSAPAPQPSAPAPITRIPVIDGKALALIQTINAARSQARTCGGNGGMSPMAAEKMSAARALQRNKALESRALDNTAPNLLVNPVHQEPYPYRTARLSQRGSGSPQEIVQQLLSDPSSCRIIMSPEFVDIATAYYRDGTEYSWTVILGTRKADQL